MTIDGTVLKKIGKDVFFKGFVTGATHAELHNGICISLDLLPSDSLTTASLSDGSIFLQSKLFKNCSKLRSVNIPRTLVSIGSEAFYGCIDLQEMTLSDNLVVIGSRSFVDCASLREMTIPQSVKSIGNECFANSGIESVTISSTQVKIIEKRTFDCCKQLKEIIIPEGVIVIDKSAFEECTRLESVHFPENVRVIGPFCFSGCRSLTTIYIPDSIEFIGDCAFFNCNNLKEVSLPSKNVNKGRNIFKGCNDVKITIRDTEESYINGENDHPSKQEDNNQKNNNPDQDTLIWPNDDDVIPPFSFKNNHNLTKVDIPKNVTVIGAGAFQGCYNIRTITIRGNPVIEKDAFSLGDECHRAECVLYSANRIPIKPVYKNMYTAIFSKYDPNLIDAIHKPSEDAHDMSRNNEDVCPRCGRTLKIVPGRYGGWFKTCPDRNCHYTTNVSTPVKKGISNNKWKKKSS